MNVKINLDEMERILDEFELLVSLADPLELVGDRKAQYLSNTHIYSSFSLDECKKFHESADTAQYVLEELIALGDPNLELNFEAFHFLLSESSMIVEEAAFSACFDFFMDLILRGSSLDAPCSDRLPLDLNEDIAREFLIQSVASRRPSVKLAKLEQALRVISERSDGSNADDLLQCLARIIPSVPLMRETVILMRTYVDVRGDPEILVGPIGYALTSIETVLGTL